MFNPTDFGSFDSMIMVFDEEAKAARKAEIDDLIADLIGCHSEYQRWAVMRAHNMSEDNLSDEEITYINSCLQSGRID